MHVAASKSCIATRYTLCALLGLLLVVKVAAGAEPPQVEYLFPAGAQRGQSVKVTAGGKFDAWPLQAWVDRAGVNVSPGEEKGELTISVEEETPPGLYWVRLYSPEGAAVAQPFIVGTLPEVEETEPNNAPSEPQVLSSTATVINGRLGGTNDVDTFAVTLHTGETLVTALDAHECLGSPMDAVIQVLSSEGFVYMLQDDERGLDPLCTFKAPTDGVYLVRVFGFPDSPNSSIRLSGAATYVYRLTLTTGGFLDRAFPLAVDAHTPATVELDGWNLPGDAVSATPLVVENAHYAVVFQPGMAQTIPLAVVDHAIVVEQEPNQRDAPQAVSWPVSVTGRLDEEDEEDCFRIDATAGTTLDVRVEARELGFPLDPVLVVLDADGKVLKELDDAAGGRDVQLDFAVGADGPLTITVRDLHGNSGPRYMYRLSIRKAEPDFELTMASDSLSIEAGKTLDVDVNIARLRAFAEPIEVTAVELPPGLSVEPVVSAAEGDTAKKVVLKFTATADLFNGPVKIEGRSQGDTQRIHPATAALKVPRTRTEQIWLTVRPASE